MYINTHLYIRSCVYAYIYTYIDTRVCILWRQFCADPAYANLLALLYIHTHTYASLNVTASVTIPASASVTISVIASVTVSVTAAILGSYPYARHKPSMGMIRLPSSVDTSQAWA